MVSWSRRLDRCPGLSLTAAEIIGDTRHRSAAVEGCVLPGRSRADGLIAGRYCLRPLRIWNKPGIIDVAQIVISGWPTEPAVKRARWKASIGREVLAISARSAAISPSTGPSAKP